jgi:Fic family protein
VIRAILLHFQLAYDHPFVDGNGRTARALFYWAMLHHEYWLFEYLSISETILKARTQYGRAFLFTETDEGDATYFLLHQAAVIRKSLDTLRQYVATKRKELADGGMVLNRLPGVNLRQKELLLHALKNPGAILTIAGHRAHYRIAYGTARTDLLRLAALGLFEQRNQGREMLFIVPNDIAARIEKASTGKE